MAIILPSAIVEDEVRSRAERAMFEILRTSLGDDYVVIHSARWYLPAREAQNIGSNGEADFVIVHPDKGLVVLEVKAGSLEYSPETGKWKIDGGTGSPRRTRRGPLEQAEGARHALEATLRRTLPQDVAITYGFAVALPESRYVRGFEPAGMPKALCIDCDDLEDIEGKVDSIFAFHGGAECRGPGDLTGLVVESLAGTPNLSTTLRSQFELMRKTIRLLTHDQFAIIRYLKHHNRVSIDGCAGSGKTIVAAEKAVRLRVAGLRTLVLCHNPALAAYLRTLIAGAGVRVEPFGAWVAQLCGIAGTGGAWTRFEEPMEDEIALAFERLALSDERYDAVIVDEGQDFRDSWWVLVDAALANAAVGILYVFHDDNQSLLPARSTYPIEPAPFSLSRNCRNTGEIFDFVKKYHTAPPETSVALARNGVLRTYTCEEGLERDAVACAVIDAVNALGSPGPLVVLTTDSDPVDRSILSGLHVTIDPRWRWQDAVARQLATLSKPMSKRVRGSAGPPPVIRLPELSEATFPTEKDVAAVTTWARAFVRVGLPPQRGRRPVWVETEQGLELISRNTAWPQGVAAVFASGLWTEGLPHPVTFKLLATATPGEEGQAIPLRTVSSFKGLEADAIVLFLRSSRDELRANAYVGASRALFLLHVVADANTLARL